jgi:peptidoglycan/xylan/chitin deacetylase (PgdA/CDA1 family)
MARQLVVTFHGLGEPPDSVPEDERDFWVPVGWFEAILDALPRAGVGLAFDDGNVSDIESALPALAERELIARFFPLTGRIGLAGYLSADDIVKLSAAGMKIGSHGLDQRDWRGLTDDELHEELVASRGMLAGLANADITEAACPFGSYDRRVLRALRRLGYERVFTSDGGTHAVGSWLCSRTSVSTSRPLQDWLDLVSRGADKPPGPVQLGKRLFKRVR